MVLQHIFERTSCVFQGQNQRLSVQRHFSALDVFLVFLYRLYFHLGRKSIPKKMIKDKCKMSKGLKEDLNYYYLFKMIGTNPAVDANKSSLVHFQSFSP